jgi:hypothetical protein
MMLLYFPEVSKDQKSIPGTLSLFKYSIGGELAHLP